MSFKVERVFVGVMLAIAFLFGPMPAFAAAVTDVYPSDNNTITSQDSDGTQRILTVNESYGESIINSYLPLAGYSALTGGSVGAPQYFDKVVDQQSSDDIWQLTMNIGNNTGISIDGYVIEIWNEAFTQQLNDLVSELVLAAPPGTTQLSTTPAAATYLFNSPLASGSNMLGSFKVDFGSTTGTFGMRQIALIESASVPIPPTFALLAIGLLIGRSAIRRRA